MLQQRGGGFTVKSSGKVTENSVAKNKQLAKIGFRKLLGKAMVLGLVLQAGSQNIVPILNKAT